MSTLHFVYGPPGAGKSTFARTLSEQLPGLLVCEDEALAALGRAIATVDDFRAAARQVRAVVAPVAIRALELGVPVVLDFAGNNARQRAWARSIFEAARADHVLHVLDVPIEECRRRMHARNEQQPPGVYFGHVSDELFDRIVPLIEPPTPDEGFHVIPV